MVWNLLSVLEGAASGFRCLGCETRFSLGALCPYCEARVRRAEGCIRCGRVGCSAERRGKAGCERLWLPYRTCSAGVAYAPPVTGVVSALKKSGSYRSAIYLAARLIGALPQEAAEVSFITWVPAAKASMKGFDHGELLARAVSHALGVPAGIALRRLDRGELKSLGRKSRLAIARSSFAATSDRTRGSVLVVDDVMTTGASLYYAALELRRAGARVVHACAGARTPLASALRTPAQLDVRGALQVEQNRPEEMRESVADAFLDETEERTAGSSWNWYGGQERYRSREHRSQTGFVPGDSGCQKGGYREPRCPKTSPPRSNSNENRA